MVNAFIVSEEDIDVTLRESLQTEQDNPRRRRRRRRRASTPPPTSTPPPAEKTQQEQRLQKIIELFNKDGEEHGLKQEDFAHIQAVFDSATVHQQKRREMKRQPHLRRPQFRKTREPVSLDEIVDYNELSTLQKLKRTHLYGALLGFTHPDGTRPPEGIKKYLNVDDEELQIYRFKKIVWVGKELRYAVPYQDVEDFELRNFATEEGPEEEEEEQEDEKEKPAQIIIPDWNPSPGQAINWMGKTSFSGDTAGKMVNDFLKDKPGIGRYAYEFSKLLRVFATMKLIQVAKGAAVDHSKLLKSKEAELDKEDAEKKAQKKASYDARRKRVAKRRAMDAANRDLAMRMGGPQESPGATLQEVISPGLLKDIEDQFKDYLKSVVRQAIGEADNKEEFGKFVEDEIKKLKVAKAKVDASEDLTKAYNDVSDYGKLVGRLMIKLANILDKNWRDLFPALDKEPEEEEEAVKEPTGTEETEEIEEMLNEDKLTEIVIDFNEIRKNELNESFLVMFGAWIKHILGAMLGDFNIPVSVRGSRGEVESFARAVGSEKKYIETAKRYGLDHPNTYKSQARLGTATKGFEKETGIKWPFK